MIPKIAKKGNFCLMFNPLNHLVFKYNSKNIQKSKNILQNLYIFNLKLNLQKGWFEPFWDHFSVQ